jgi:ketosteroid isomerase-like protein
LSWFRRAAWYWCARIRYAFPFFGGVQKTWYHEGKEGMRERNRQFTETWGDLVYEPVEFIDAGDDVVVAVIAMQGSGKGSGAPLDAPAVFVYELRDGKIVRDRAFESKSEALEAAGLKE